MEIQQIINYIVSNVRSTHAAFVQKGLDYDPQIIARPAFKELKRQDPSLDESQFLAAIEKMHDDGLVLSKANGLIFFSEEVLGRELAEA
jgi:hypothetical protein